MAAAPQARTADDDKVSITPRVKASDKGPKAPEVEQRSDRIRVDTTLVQINVTVTDPLNRFVTGLEKEHFKLFEDKIEQKILDFSSRGRAALHRSGVRYQREHGAEAAKVAPGRGAVL